MIFNINHIAHCLRGSRLSPLTPPAANFFQDTSDTSPVPSKFSSNSAIEGLVRYSANE